MTLNYLGSKLKLSNSIVFEVEKFVQNNNISVSSVCDLFSGTGIIGFELSKTLNCKVCRTVDTEIYSQYISSIHFNRVDEKQVNSFLTRLAKNTEINETNTFISIEYSEKRQFFSCQNGKLIGNIRNEIDKESDKETRNYLIACLIMAADKVANTASVYGAFLKKLKNSAKKNVLNIFTKICEKYIKNSKTKHFHHLGNVLEETQFANLVYLDSPYNKRQYSSNYHVLNTIAKNDTPKLHGKTGQRPDNFISDFCKRKNVKESFRQLFSNIFSNSCVQVCCVSYSSEGLLNIETLLNIMFEHVSEITLISIPYKKFQSKKTKGTGFVFEYLLICKNDL